MVVLDIFQAGVTSIKWRNNRRRPTKDSSIQFSSWWYLCAPSRLSEVSLTLPLKHFQCSSYWRYLSSFEGRALEVLLGFSTSVGSHTDSWSEILSPPSSVIGVRWVCCLLFVCVNENPTKHWHLLDGDCTEYVWDYFLIRLNVLLLIHSRSWIHSRMIQCT